jgi:membrane protease YdiL (CAAX protease family)
MTHYPSQIAVGLKPFLVSVGALAIVETGGSLVSSTDLILCLLRVLEIILFLVIFMIWSEGLFVLGLGAAQIFPGLKRGLIWSAGFGIAVFLGFGILFFIGINPFALFHARFPEQTWELLLFLILRGVIGPVAEEIFFRGILYGFLRRLGLVPALFLSTLPFILAHPVAGLPQTVGGILFAIAYETEKRLMVPITIHVLGNLAIFGVSGLSKMMGV